MSRAYSEYAHKFRLIENPCADNYDCQAWLHIEWERGRGRESHIYYTSLKWHINYLWSAQIVAYFINNPKQVGNKWTVQVEIENRVEEIEENFRKLIMTMMMYNIQQELPVVVLNLSFFLLHVHKSLSLSSTFDWGQGCSVISAKIILTEVYNDHKKSPQCQRNPVS